MFGTRDVYAQDNEYFICKISEQDKENYTELKVQMDGKDSLFLDPICRDMVWKSVLEGFGNTKSYSIFDLKSEYCGNLELTDLDMMHPELGINLLEEKRNQGIAPKIIRMFAEAFYKERKIEFFVVRILAKNMHSIHVFEKMGAVMIGRESKRFSGAMGTVKSTFEAGDTEKWEESMGEIYDKDDDEIILRYKLLPKLFVNSNR